MFMNTYALKDLKLPLSFGYKDIISKTLLDITDIKLLLTQSRISGNIQFCLSNTTDTKIALNNNNKINLWELSQQICFLVTHFPYSTLQILAETISEFLFKLFTTNSPHQSCSSITKIHIQLQIVSPNNILSTASSLTNPVDANFMSADCPLTQETNSWGHVDIIKEFSEFNNNGISVGLYVLHINPGHSIPLHVHKIMTESEMVISHNLICQKIPVLYGTTHTWYSAPHMYSNQSQGQQSILCIDSPAFIPTDEVLIEGEPASNMPMVLMKNYLFDAKPMFYFPGLFSSKQQILLTIHPSQFSSKSHAILVYAFNLNNELLFVNHKKRGWELPGGKVELNENEIEACIRETFEESYCELDQSSLQSVAQYKLIDEDNVEDEHIKAVYVARVKLAHQNGRFEHETEQRKFVSAPEWFTILNESYSVLLHDDVYPICLELAKQKLSI